MFSLFIVTLVAAAAGVVNSIAGGGTLLTFPALVALGMPPIAANATNTMALWPGTFGSMWGYRAELTGARRWAISFAIPSLAGGLVGALLLLRTPPEQFSAIAPWLVLGATMLFMAQGPISARLRRQAIRASTGTKVEPSGDPGLQPELPADSPSRSAVLPSPPLAYLGYQLLVGIYGGYFGAGVGILMLAALGLMGLKNIHQMNGLKNWGGLCMNVMAALTFAFSDLVNWRVALAMAAGAVAGGYGGSRVAQRVGQAPVRRAIVVIGLASAAWLYASRAF